MVIRSLKDIIGTQVVRAVKDGKNSFFARVTFSVRSGLDFTYLNRALESNRIHLASKVTEEDLRTGKYILEIAHPKDYEGLEFSYPD